MSRISVFNDIHQERERQIAKWGEQRAPDNPWLAILTEEVGEVAQEICHAYIGRGSKDALYAELIQVAAVSVAWLESLREQEPTRTRTYLTSIQAWCILHLPKCVRKQLKKRKSLP